MATTTHTDSWLFTDTSRAALFDELAKIGAAAGQAGDSLEYIHQKIAEEPKKEPNKDALKRALSTGLAAAGGVGAGYLAGEGITRAAEHFWPGSIRPKKPIPGRGSFKHRVLTIGLPIGAGVGATLWSRAHQKRKAKLQGDDSR